MSESTLQGNILINRALSLAILFKDQTQGGLPAAFSERCTHSIKKFNQAEKRDEEPIVALESAYREIMAQLPHS